MQAVDPDAPRREFLGGRAHQSNLGMLGGDVVGKAFEADELDDLEVMIMLPPSGRRGVPCLRM
jgi:hypothetical protein